MLHMIHGILFIDNGLTYKTMNLQEQRGLRVYGNFLSNLARNITPEVCGQRRRYENTR